jgi:hypothetical protein
MWVFSGDSENMHVVIPAKAGQKSPGAIFEQPKAGPEGAEYMDVFRNPGFL